MDRQAFVQGYLHHACDVRPAERAAALAPDIGEVVT
jgi:hypothetical protein